MPRLAAASESPQHAGTSCEEASSLQRSAAGCLPRARPGLPGSAGCCVARIQHMLQGLLEVDPREVVDSMRVTSSSISSKGRVRSSSDRALASESEGAKAADPCRHLKNLRREPSRRGETILPAALLLQPETSAPDQSAHNR